MFIPVRFTGSHNCMHAIVTTSKKTYAFCLAILIMIFIEFGNAFLTGKDNGNSQYTNKQKRDITAAT